MKTEPSEEDDGGTGEQAHFSAIKARQMENGAFQISNTVLPANPKAPRGILMERRNASGEDIGTETHALKTNAIVAKKAVFSGGPQNPRSALEQNVDVQIAKALGLAVLFERIALSKTRRG